MQLETRFRKQCIAASDSVGTEEITSDPSYGNTKALCVPDRIATSSLVEQPAPRHREAKAKLYPTLRSSFFVGSGRASSSSHSNDRRSEEHTSELQSRQY